MVNEKIIQYKITVFGLVAILISTLVKIGFEFEGDFKTIYFVVVAGLVFLIIIDIMKGGLLD